MATTNLLSLELFSLCIVLVISIVVLSDFLNEIFTAFESDVCVTTEKGEVVDKTIVVLSKKNIIDLYVRINCNKVIHA